MVGWEAPDKAVEWNSVLWVIVVPVDWWPTIVVRPDGLSDVKCPLLVAPALATSIELIANEARKRMPSIWHLRLIGCSLRRGEGQPIALRSALVKVSASS
jgi:hypothetical protein